jgi:trehalose 6-phosphate synthase/phosphatase
MVEKRLFIITNRLPVYFTEEGIAKAKGGGLASSIQAYLQKCKAEDKREFTEVYWFGITGCSAAEWGKASYNLESSEYNFIPVHVPAKVYQAYYHAIANTVIWPLFHYFPSYANYDVDAYQDYQKANEIFSETIKRHVRANDVIWIHDYHLLLLPALLRKTLPDLTIGFFLHIPFPSYEVFRLMPRSWQKDLINGMLGADLVGFQTIDYATHFLESVRMILKIESEIHVIQHDNRLVKIDIFPISIHFSRFFDAYNKPEVAAFRKSLKDRFSDKKIIFSIGRLNYTKGTLNRIDTYGHFLTRYPEFRNKVVFILTIIPSLDDAGKYSHQKKMIDEAISNVNSKVGNVAWQPLVYQYNSLSFDLAIAIYTASDVALITPLRDGMNLISKEFVASRKDKKGVLVLSELAGAAKELTGALLTNPNDIPETAEQIRVALEMDEQEQAERMDIMQMRLSAYDVCAWSEDFIRQIYKAKQIQKDFHIRFFNDYTRRAVFHTYQKAKGRLFLLDYDGTLVPYAKHPEDATAGKSLRVILEQLCSDQRNDVYVLSGRTSDWLDQQLGHLPLSLIAEDGAALKVKSGTWEKGPIASNEWKDRIRKVMEEFTRRCAASFIEEKEFSLVWHYANAIPEQGRLRSLELFSELNRYINDLNVHLVRGNKILEVRQRGIGKDIALKRILSQRSYEFILAMGDDANDEEMFRLLADNDCSYSIKIGSEASYAKYNLLTQQMAISFLENFIALKPVVGKH